MFQLESNLVTYDSINMFGGISRKGLYPILPRLVIYRLAYPRNLLSNANIIHSQADIARTKRTSPYRLLSPLSFLSSFAPLHTQGWRLIPINETRPGISISADDIRAENGDLQDRRLIRVWGFEQYGEALGFLSRIGLIAQEQDVSRFIQRSGELLIPFGIASS
jgi:hypothetical protein